METNRYGLTAWNILLSRGTLSDSFNFVAAKLLLFFFNDFLRIFLKRFNALYYSTD